MAGNHEWKLVFQKKLTATDINMGRTSVPSGFHNNDKAYLPPEFHATLKGETEKLRFNAKRFTLSGLGKFTWYNQFDNVGQAFILLKKHPSSAEEEEEFSVVIQDNLLDFIGTVYDPDPITANPPGQDLEFVFKCRLSDTYVESGRVVVPDHYVKHAKDKNLAGEQTNSFEATLKGETQTLSCSVASVRKPGIADFRSFAWFKENAEKGQQLYLWKHKLEPNKVVIEIVEDPKTHTAGPRHGLNDPGPSHDHVD